MAKQRMGLGLQQRMHSARDYDTLDVNIFLKGEHSHEMASRQVDFALESMDTVDAVDEPPIGSKVADQLREQCADEQKDLIEMLTASATSDVTDEMSYTDDFIEVAPAESDVTSYWINNAVAASVTRGMLDEIMKRNDVAYVEVARYADLEELMDAKKKKATKKKTKKKRATKKTSKKKASKKKYDRSTRLKRTVSGGLSVSGAADSVTIPWSVNRINAPKLWSLNLKGKGVLVAVLDTGVNYNHPDLKSRMWKGGAAFPNHGYDFSSNDNDPIDNHGHGTSCASQVAGTGASGIQTGVAPEATIMALRVGGAERNYWNAMQFAITHDVDVISMSMSWKYPSNPNYPGWRRACESLLAAGMLHANSIGNQGDRLSTHPIPFNIATPGNCPPPRMHPLQSPTGGFTSVISCGATDDLDSLAGYSGRGPAAWENAPFTDYPYQNGTKPGLIKPDVCAPGPGTTSCHWPYTGSGSGVRPYRPFGGTAAATPHVGGCLALPACACKKANTPLVPARMQEALENTAVRVNGQTLDKENHYGAGRVDVYGAYKYGRARGWW